MARCPVLTTPERGLAMTWSLPRMRAARQSLVKRMRLNVEHLEYRTLLSGGVLDPTFGDGGLVKLSTPGERIALQADGKIVVLSEIFPPSVPGLTSTGALAVSRLDSDGSLDTIFGTNGQTLL